MARKKKELNPLVAMSNVLVRSRRKDVTSIWALRLIALIAMQVKKDDEALKVYRIPVTEFLGGNYGGETLNMIREGVTQAMNNIMEIPTDRGVMWTAPLFNSEYVEKEGILELQFNPKIKDHYLNLKDKFTEYSYVEFMKLPSTYSQRIFEILKSWQNFAEKPFVEIKIDDLHDMLGTPDYFREDFSRFRLKVLDKAYHDIVESGDIHSLWYAWEAVRSGKGRGGGKVTAIRFMFDAERAERYAEEVAKAEREKERAARAALQERANTCYHKYKAALQECKPNMQLPKCKYCFERGGKYVETIIADQEPAVPLDGQTDLFGTLKN